MYKGVFHKYVCTRCYFFLIEGAPSIYRGSNKIGGPVLDLSPVLDLRSFLDLSPVLDLRSFLDLRPVLDLT